MCRSQILWKDAYVIRFYGKAKFRTGRHTQQPQRGRLIPSYIEPRAYSLNRVTKHNTMSDVYEVGAVLFQRIKFAAAIPSPDVIVL